MKFIHAADLHLDSPFLGLHNDSLPPQLWEIIRDSTFKSFKKIVDDAISQQVDFVLLSGDLFDRQERSVSAQVFLMKQLQRLSEQRISVFIIFGNHDYYRGDFKNLDYPKNTQVFGNQVETKELRLPDGQLVAIHGFSFGSQWVTQPIINDYPLAANADWNIGMLHGSLATLKSPEANYAPFTLEQLQSKNYDYWALGHIHKRQSLDNRGVINYSGNSQGRHINESGEKGYLLVKSTGHNLAAEFRPTAPIIWQILTVPVTTQSVNGLASLIMSQIERQKYPSLHFIRIRLTSKQSLPKAILESVTDGDLLAAVQQLMGNHWQQLNCWITSIRVHVFDQVILSSLDQRFFEEAKEMTLTQDQLIKLMDQGLSKYPFIKADLADPANQQDLFNQASALLQEQVLHSDDEGDSSK
ncbi:hypothetical protein YK48G_03650 [Lentilactobacillus fungorum]|uniref:Calcineurin-like phosphoesterase domain-containing protein n=1 Tax=Lentilactobacillus fungorum TaxID=2201250 RepID=A0ABQ3VVN3_9LACO|nr:DNA repair exonuclease [Lentilactobacillus fungorum]GHP12940.1 hypothetical protein YK48G_03650 [Lentilactobacillus fungorum]